MNMQSNNKQNKFTKSSYDANSHNHRRNNNTTENKSTIHKISKASLKTVMIAFKTIFIIGLIVACTLGGLLIGVVSGCIITTKPLTKEDLYISGFTSYIYDRNGKIIAELKGSDNINRSEVDIETVPQDLIDAFVSIEDERFYSHSGVDIKRTISASLGFFLPGMSSHGGSTITQQMVKTVTGDDSRSVPRKIREQWRAYQLEKDYSKDEILEIYLNVIYMGQDLYGVKTASKAYFEKDISELNLAECAFLSGITNNPGKYNPLTTLGRENAYKRQIIILDQMLKLGKITEEEYIEAIQTKINFNEDYRKDSSLASKYSYFVDAVITDLRNDLKEKGYTNEQASNIIYNTGIQIYTTQDGSIQKIVDEEYCNVKNFPANGRISDADNQAQSAIVILDQKTGQVVAMYGGYGEKNKNLSFNRATSAYRQPGSAIKPLLVYGPLVDTHKITPSTVIEDKEVFLDPQRPDEPWPVNSGGWHAGLITTRIAVARSSNICAVLYYKDNIQLGLNYLKKLGIDRTDEVQLAAALGGFSKGVTPIQMASAYATFANSGVRFEPITYTKVLDKNGNVIINKVPDATIVYEDDRTPYIMTSILQDVLTDTYGTGKAAQIFNAKGEKILTAGKTGTTSNAYDFWFCGYTPYYTAAVWYGYDNLTAISSEESGAAVKIFNKVFTRIHTNLSPKPFDSISGIIEAEVCTLSGQAPTPACYASGKVVKDIFMKGTEPKIPCQYHNREPETTEEPQSENP